MLAVLGNLPVFFDINVFVMDKSGDGVRCEIILQLC